MSDNRQTYLGKCKSILVKVGSAVLTNADGLNLEVLNNLADQLARLKQSGRRVTLVSSGAVAAGRTTLAGTSHKVEDMSGRQAAAAIGQSRLMRSYEDAFARHQVICAQVLLTREDLRDRTRFLHAQQTFSRLLDWQAIPIVNENDTVAIQELKFGDNDFLASLLLNMVEADLFVNLTSIGGVLSQNPLTSENPAQIPLFTSIENIQHLDIDGLCGGKTKVGTGGMYSKLLAARRVAQLGVPTLILPGREPDIIDRAFAGAQLGTWIAASTQYVSRRKYWLAYQTDPQGTIHIDPGAAKALSALGKSLLPGGVNAVQGNFEIGSLISIMCADVVLGVGLSNYSDRDLRKIMGLKRHEVAAILGNAYYPEVVHRDNMLLNAAV